MRSKYRSRNKWQIGKTGTLARHHPGDGQECPSSDSNFSNDSDGRLFLGTNDFHSIDVADPLAPKFDAALTDLSKNHTVNG